MKVLSALTNTLLVDKADPNDPNELSFEKKEILRIDPDSTKDKWWQGIRSNGDRGSK